MKKIIYIVFLSSLLFTCKDESPDCQQELSYGSEIWIEALDQDKLNIDYLNRIVYYETYYDNPGYYTRRYVFKKDYFDENTDTLTINFTVQLDSETKNCILYYESDFYINGKYVGSNKSYSK